VSYCGVEMVSARRIEVAFKNIRENAMVKYIALGSSLFLLATGANLLNAIQAVHRPDVTLSFLGWWILLAGVLGICAVRSDRTRVFTRAPAFVLNFVLAAGATLCLASAITDPGYGGAGFPELCAVVIGLSTLNLFCIVMFNHRLAGCSRPNESSRATET
jgi:hypothetical protein